MGNLGTIFLLLNMPGGGALAHFPSAEWYRSKWKADHHTGLNITWRFSPGFLPAFLGVEVFPFVFFVPVVAMFFTSPDCPTYSDHDTRAAWGLPADSKKRPPAHRT